MFHQGLTNAAGVNFSAMNIFISAIVGLVVTGAIFWITEYYTSTEYGPVQHIAQADRKSTRLNSSHSRASRMPSSA